MKRLALALALAPCLTACSDKLGIALTNRSDDLATVQLPRGPLAIPSHEVRTFTYPQDEDGQLRLTVGSCTLSYRLPRGAAIPPLVNMARGLVEVTLRPDMSLFAASPVSILYRDKDGIAQIEPMSKTCA